MKLYKIVRESTAKEIAKHGLKPNVFNGTEMVCLSANPTAIQMLTPSGFESDSHAIIYETTRRGIFERLDPDVEWWTRISFVVPDWEVEDWTSWAIQTWGFEEYFQFTGYIGGEEFTESLRFTRQPVLPNQIVQIERLDDPMVWSDVTSEMKNPVSSISMTLS